MFFDGEWVNAMFIGHHSLYFFKPNVGLVQSLSQADGGSKETTTTMLTLTNSGGYISGWTFGKNLNEYIGKDKKIVIEYSTNSTSCGWRFVNNATSSSVSVGAGYDKFVNIPNSTSRRKYECALDSLISASTPYLAIRNSVYNANLTFAINIYDFHIESV